MNDVDIVNLALKKIGTLKERVMPYKEEVKGFKITTTENGFIARKSVSGTNGGGRGDVYELDAQHVFESFNGLARFMAEQLGINTNAVTNGCSAEKSPAQIDEIVRLRGELQRWEKLHDGMPIEHAERAKSLARSIIERINHEEEKEAERRRESRRKAATKPAPAKASPPRKR